MATSDSSPWKVIRETVILLVVALVLAIGVKTFFVQAFYIPSGSMEPGLQINDRILVEKPSYWFGHPQRGDIVVFNDPGDWLTASDDSSKGFLSSALEKIGLYPSGGHLVKRVIGVGGDTIVCCDKQGRISVNGTPLDEDSFIAPQQSCDGPMAGCQTGWKAVVPKDKLFVMGDNRSNSADSSAHLCGATSPTTCDPNDAYVDEKLVVGRVISLVWPLKRFKIEHRPDIFADIAKPTSN
ncbi:signal peptidase I [Nocardioides sp.]|uniref:signal peptidase I n=1 Tax=Nocardioides sp. TaxID=35761 RepID=UPI0026138828|nr:signal peptidase I [Nocardioides sp.]